MALGRGLWGTGPPRCVLKTWPRLYYFLQNFQFRGVAVPKPLFWGCDCPAGLPSGVSGWGRDGVWGAGLRAWVSSGEAARVYGEAGVARRGCGSPATLAATPLPARATSPLSPPTRGSDPSPTTGSDPSPTETHPQAPAQSSDPTPRLRHPRSPPNRLRPSPLPRPQTLSPPHLTRELRPPRPAPRGLSSTPLLGSTHELRAPPRRLVGPAPSPRRSLRLIVSLDAGPAPRGSAPPPGARPRLCARSFGGRRAP